MNYDELINLGHEYIYSYANMKRLYPKGVFIHNQPYNSMQEVTEFYKTYYAINKNYDITGIYPVILIQAARISRNYWLKPRNHDLNSEKLIKSLIESYKDE